MPDTGQPRRRQRRVSSRGIPFLGAFRAPACTWRDGDPRHAPPRPRGMASGWLRQLSHGSTKVRHLTTQVLRRPGPQTSPTGAQSSQPGPGTATRASGACLRAYIAGWVPRASRAGPDAQVSTGTARARASRSRWWPGRRRTLRAALRQERRRAPAPRWQVPAARAGRASAQALAHQSRRHSSLGSIHPGLAASSIPARLGSA